MVAPGYNTQRAEEGSTPRRDLVTGIGDVVDNSNHSHI